MGALINYGTLKEKIYILSPLAMTPSYGMDTVGTRRGAGTWIVHIKS